MENKNQKALSDLIQSDGWKIVRQKFIDKIMDIQSVLNVDVTSVDKVIVDIKARTTVVEILSSMIKEIEGSVVQEKFNSQKEMERQTKESFILNLDDAIDSIT